MPKFLPTVRRWMSYESHLGLGTRGLNRHEFWYGKILDSTSILLERSD